MQKLKILKKLKNDADYYGDFGKQFLSNSDIYHLLNNPLKFHQPSIPSPAFLVGGYFHTTILEPEKLEKFKVIKSTTRNTKNYKEMSGGELCLLQHEVDNIELMREVLMDNDICRELISDPVFKKCCEYEVPMIKEIEGITWKGKADIVNHDEKLVIDKNTHQIGMFDCSPRFYESGLNKVRMAVEVYDLFFKTEDFDPKQYFINETL